jgi:hypothetical protein
MEALSFPPVSNDLAEAVASTLFAGQLRIVPTPNPEILGGSTALVAINDNLVQEPPASLTRMHASVRSQAAFNRTIMEKEVETVSINSDMADFLAVLSMTETVKVFVNVPGRLR